MPSMADLCFSHLRWSMQVLLYTKTQALSVQFAVNLLIEFVHTIYQQQINKWSFSFTVHVLANNRQLCAFIIN